MSDNFNITTTQAQADEAGGTDPNDPSQNIGTMMAKSQQNQALQAQLVAQAIEHTKQAQMQTGLDAGGGLGQEKGLVGKAQAISTVRLALKNNDADEADIKSALDDAQANWPDPVNSAVVDRLVWSLRPHNVSKIGEGAPYPATGTETDANDNPIKKGAMIQEVLDNEGNSTFIHSAIPASVQSAGINADAKSAQADAKSTQADEKKLLLLGNKIYHASMTRFGGSGTLVTTVIRATRALNTLSHFSGGTLTEQDLSNVSTDIAAIYQGGVPGMSQIADNAYGTSYTSFINTIRHYLGFLGKMGVVGHKAVDESVTKLTGVLTDMRTSALAQLKQSYESYVPQVPGLSLEQPAVMSMIDAAMASASAGTVDANGNIQLPTSMTHPSDITPSPAQSTPPVGAGGGAPPPVGASAAADPLGILK